MKFKKLSVASSLAIAACISTPAFAQDESEAQEESETRQKPDQRHRRDGRVPRSKPAGHADRDHRGQCRYARQRADRPTSRRLPAQAPNVTLTPQPQNGGSGLIAFIRGVGQVDFNYALDPGVGVYVDDVFIPTLSSIAARADRSRPHRSPARAAGHAGRQELHRRLDQAVQRASAR